MDAVINVSHFLPVFAHIKPPCKQLLTTRIIRNEFFVYRLYNIISLCLKLIRPWTIHYYDIIINYIAVVDSFKKIYALFIIILYTNNNINNGNYVCFYAVRS